MKLSRASAALFALGVFLCSHSLHAFYIKVSEEELIKKSNWIVVGSVLERQSYWNNDHSLIYTDFRVSVENSLKGNDRPDSVTVTVLGGTVGDISLRVSDEPAFEMNEQVLLFLERTGEAKARVVYGIQGKYSIRDHSVVEIKEDIARVMERIRATVNNHEKKDK